MNLDKAWPAPPARASGARSGRAMLAIWAEQVFTIGIVGGVLQPVVVNARLRNVPQGRRLSPSIPAPISASTSPTRSGSPTRRRRGHAG